MSNYKGKDKHNNADNQYFKANKANFTVHFILFFLITKITFGSIVRILIYLFINTIIQFKHII